MFDSTKEIPVALENIEMFIKIKNSALAQNYGVDFSKTHFFGDVDSLMNHQVLVNEKLTFIAQSQNEYYNRSGELKNHQRLNFCRMCPIKRYSNTYSAINLRFKLNLLGLDLVPEEDERLKLSQDEFDSFYGTLRTKNIDDYDVDNRHMLSPRKALAFQEHLRWCAFYLFNGFAPMKKKDIKIVFFEKPNGGIGFEVITKDEAYQKTHACLTTYKGLHELAVFIISQILKKDPLASFIDVYQKIEMLGFDFDAMDNIVFTATAAGLKIVKKDMNVHH